MASAGMKNLRRGIIAWYFGHDPRSGLVSVRRLVSGLGSGTLGVTIALFEPLDVALQFIVLGALLGHTRTGTALYP